MEVKKYLEYIEKIEKENGTITKMFFVYQAKDFDQFKELSEEQQEKFIDYFYTYYLYNDLTENFIYSYIDIFFNELYYSNAILQDFDNLSYKDFENILNDKI